MSRTKSSGNPLLASDQACAQARIQVQRGNVGAAVEILRTNGTDAYKDCRHYWPENLTKYDQCQDPALTPLNSTVRYGETSASNVDQFILRRATFNPDFERMMTVMTAFLEDSLPRR